ncbi:hypothetical protein QYE76_024253 [Lolium multiflorum]|uniref:Protein ALP1-like n=1 Tax=Lolium multiflorum TaxID=4521 RepID=A0AAD8RDC0_LOLMU|nr:hypothetical protein QYE76_024253 [Lolium multiflorum]
MQGKASRVSYEVNGNEYGKPYYLDDGIYPDWATLVKTVRNPNSEKTRRFAKMQEACRKDVERGFGVLQARWAIVRHPARTWSLKTMHEVMTCCVIMHNMIVENELSFGRFPGAPSTARRHGRLAGGWQRLAGGRPARLRLVASAVRVVPHCCRPAALQQWLGPAPICSGKVI